MISKKAQVTLFIIIGIIILIVSLVVILITRTGQEQNQEQSSIKTAEVPLEFQPINDFVESCIFKVGKEGIQKIGFHGGYVDLNKYGIRTTGSSTQSRAFLFNPQDSKTGVPYWNYFRSDNKCQTNCECGSEQPYLRESEGSPNVETQLKDYLEENLNLCFNEFETFKRLGFDVKTTGEPSAKVNVRDDDVLFTVKYKLEAKKADLDFKIEDFIKTVPVELTKAFNLAKEIKEAEVKNNYLERWTNEQISGFSLGIDSQKLPPVAAFELDPGKSPAYWIKSKVESDIKNNMLPLYTPFFTVFNTKNFNKELIGTFYERAIIPDLNSSDYQDLDVKFNYFNWWSIYFDITGRGVSGQKIGPETTSSSFFSFIGIKRYNFYYDVSYPVLVDIYSKDSFNNEGFHFYFGLESNVRDNEPINCTGSGAIEYAAPYGSLFCDDKQGCANITMQTVDAKTGAPLDSVNVYYSSGLESCDKGFTQLETNKAYVTTEMPQCVGSGCSLNAVKEGYWSYPKNYAVRCGQITSVCSNENVLCNQESVVINMEPLRNNSIVVMKKKMTKQSQKTWVFGNAAEKLLDNEYAVVSLQKIKDDLNEEDLSLVGIFNGNESSINLYPGLVPGNYELRIDLIYRFPDYKNREQVEFQSVEECSDGILGLNKDCTTVGPYNFTENFVEGGFVGNITLTKEMLDNSNTITFYTLSSPDIDTSYNVLDIYDMDEIGKLENYSSTYLVQLKPTSS